jgi:hypothetical protein
MLAEMANKYNVENFSMADAASKQTLAAYQNAWNNRAMADMIGKSNPYYMMDPTTGRTIFKGGRNPFVDRAASATSGNPFAAYQSYVDQAMKSGMTKEQAHDIVAKMFTGSRSNSVDSNYDGIPDRMTSAYNPYMAMFNQNMGGMNAMLASLLGR